jgi:hypothetical protein
MKERSDPFATLSMKVDHRVMIRWNLCDVDLERLSFVDDGSDVDQWACQ